MTINKSNNEVESQLDIDVCIMGTGLTECLIAASLASLGLKVLHLDSFSFYGRSDATLPFPCFLDFLKSLSDQDQHQTTHMYQCESNLLFEEPYVQWDPFQTFTTPNKDLETYKAALNSHRLYIDLHPRLLYANGSLASVLVSSGVARYIEFTNVDAVYVIVEKLIRTDSYEKQSPPSIQEQFPLPLRFEQSFESKNAIFNNENITLLEKRLLMKTLKYLFFSPLNHNVAQNPDQLKVLSQNFISPAAFYYQKADRYPFSQSTPWNEILKKLDIPDSLACRLTYGFCLKSCLDNPEQPNIHHNWTLRDVSERIRLITSSLRRYSTGAYLFPMYGTGDMPQAFSRYCAVKSGIYMLSTMITKMEINSEGCNAQHDKGYQEIHDKQRKEFLVKPPCYKLFLDNSVIVTSRHFMASRYDIGRIKKIYDSRHQKDIPITSIFSNKSFKPSANRTIRSMRLVAFVTETLLPQTDSSSNTKFCVVASKRNEPVHIYECSKQKENSTEQYFIVHMTQALRESEPNQGAESSESPKRYTYIMALLQRFMENRPDSKCILATCWTQVQSFHDVFVPPEHTSLTCLPDPLCLPMPFEANELNIAKQVVHQLLDTKHPSLNAGHECLLGDQLFPTNQESDAMSDTSLECVTLQ